MTRRQYPSDLSDTQWKSLRSFLPKASHRGRKRIYDRRSVMNAILYLVRSGCQLRMLPSDFPLWRTVYQIFCHWRLNGKWERIHDALRDRARRRAGRNRCPSAAIIDSQSVKTTESGGPKGYDGGMKISGRKRHIVVDTLGVVLAVIVHPADQQDQDGDCLVLYALREQLKRIRVIFADSAYGSRGLPQSVRSTLGYTLELAHKAKGTTGFEVIRKRSRPEQSP